MCVKIIGTGSYAPDKILSNTDLEKMVDTSDEWITTRTGIKERHIAEESTPTSDLALKAAQNAMAMAGISPDQLDLVAVASVTGDKTFPSTACILQRKIKAMNAACFDLNAACSGFLYSLETVCALLKSKKKYKTALVLGAEKLTSLVDWEDRSTCVLFGDGAGAVVLQCDETRNDPLILASSLGADGNYEDILQLPAGGSAMPPSHETIDKRLHYMKMAGQEVFKLAVNAMVKSCREALDESNVSTDDIRWLIPHQANLRILKAVGTRLKIPTERIYINVDRYGNTSAASIAIALDEIVRTKQVEKDDLMLLTAFGGGLTWGSLLIKW